MTNQYSDHFDRAYAEYNKVLRTWFVAFGVGVPVASSNIFIAALDHIVEVQSANVYTVQSWTVSRTEPLMKGNN